MSEVSYRLPIRRLAIQWQLTEEQYLCLLKLGPGVIPDLLKIDTTLKQLFAGSPLLAELWMTTRNKGLANETPMAQIERDGVAGLKRIVDFVCLER